jgi:hypothetical protein
MSELGQLQTFKAAAIWDRKKDWRIRGELRQPSLPIVSKAPTATVTWPS